MKKSTKPLDVLASVDFDWVEHTDSVWKDSNYHIPDLHENIRQEILQGLEKLKRKNDNLSPLGTILVGQGGSGKTHFLRSLRKEAAQRNAGFIMVDMTGVRDFWETVLLAFLDSLEKPYQNNISQAQILLEQLVKKISKKSNLQVRKLVKQLASQNIEHTIKAINVIIKNLYKIYRDKIRSYQDVIRAVILLNSDNFEISDIGYNWLQGIGIEDGDKERFKFTTSAQPAKTIVKALSWLMSTYTAVILAIDQMDPIVAQHNYASRCDSDEFTRERNISLSIIEEFASGLSALVDPVTKRTLVLVSCLEATWHIISEKTLATNKARFKTLKQLQPLKQENIASKIISTRLNLTYAEKGFKPPYQTWPFATECFKTSNGLFPREILQRCHRHIETCIAENKISELESFIIPPVKPVIIQHIDFPELEEKFQILKKEALLDDLLDEKKEDTVMDDLLETACKCLIKENKLPDNINVSIDPNFSGEKSFSFLHVRFRFTFTSEDEREEHYCLRALLKTNAIAYQNRLKAAITTSGIDRNLQFRKLIIIRNNEVPTGAKTKEITDKFLTSGGSFCQISEDELRSLYALQELIKNSAPNFNRWIRGKRVVSGFSFFKDGFPGMFKIFESNQREEDKTLSIEKDKNNSDAHSSRNEKVTITDTNTDIIEPVIIINPIEGVKLPLGQVMIANKPKDEISISAQDLTKHIAVLAGSGAGKTVLVRRLVEEAALIGIPSIVIDCANDLSRMGDKWPQQPQDHSENDLEKSERYFKETETIIWTPGVQKGNPLNLEAIPDLSSLINDVDELENAIAITRESMVNIVAPGNSQKAKNKVGVLSAALKYFANNEMQGLEEFIELLSNLPIDAGGGMTKAEKLALEMSDSLKSELQTNVLLKSTGSILDPQKLFFVDKALDKSCISVINLGGLASLSVQQQFINQLAMTLFTWIKKNPAPVERPITGLLVIDEAKDFVPSGKGSFCKDSLLRLTAQARKYGLGIIFATQAPKSIDHNIIANCTTHFYGKANSPAAIDVIVDQIKLRRGSGSDVPNLKTGMFYLSSESIEKVVKVKSPLCLSYHPMTPLSGKDIIDRAKKSRKLLKTFELNPDLDKPE